MYLFSILRIMVEIIQKIVADLLQNLLNPKSVLKFSFPHKVSPGLFR